MCCLHSVSVCVRAAFVVNHLQLSLKVHFLVSLVWKGALADGEREGKVSLEVSICFLCLQFVSFVSSYLGEPLSTQGSPKVSQAQNQIAAMANRYLGSCYMLVLVFRAILSRIVYGMMMAAPIHFFSGLYFLFLLVLLPPVLKKALFTLNW